MTTLSALMLAAVVSTASVSGTTGSAAAFVSEPEPATPKRDKPIALGEKMPTFKLANADGKMVDLAAQLANGPVVVTFYRGDWCPYCVKALGSVEESVADINKLGGSVLAISPQTQTHAIDMREKLGLTYELLVDRDNRLATALGLMFTLDPETVERYRKLGIDVGSANGTDIWQLPIPATYVLDKNGTVRYAWTNEDYSKRAPAEAVLDTLRVISQEE